MVMFVLVNVVKMAKTVKAMVLMLVFVVLLELDVIVQIAVRHHG